VECAFEQRAFMRDAVDVRCLHVGMAAGAEFVKTQVIDQDHQDVRLFLVHAFLSYAFTPD